MRRYFLVLLAVLMAALGTGSAVAQADLPTLADLTPGEWNELLPGGETTCAYGGEYRFYVRPAAAPSDQLLVFFQGGGACWDATNCSPAFQGPDGNPIFKSVVVPGESASYNQGIFDFTNPENPFADYNVVYVPYCSADVHTGNAIHEYDAGNVQYTIRHKGYVNATAALDWMYANYPDPANVFVSGCSAGAYGSIFHAPNIMAQYDAARVTQLADAGVGVTPRGWEGLNSWNFYDNLSKAVPDYAKIEPAKFRINQLYQGAARAFPNQTFAQYTTYLDRVQIGFFFLQGGGETPEAAGGNWLTGMRANLTGLNGSLPNFRSYMAWGNSHCATDKPDFYTYQVNGVRLRDWVADLAAGQPVRTVNCTECTAPELYAPAQ